MSKNQLSWEDLLNSKPDLPAPAAVSDSNEIVQTNVDVAAKPKKKVKAEAKTATAETKTVKIKIEPEVFRPTSTPAVNPMSAAKVAVKNFEVKEATVEFAPSAEPEVLTVSELNKAIKQSLEGEFGLIWLKAEISNFKAQTSGHFYFSLKDSKSQIQAVMFRGFNSQLRFRPEDGMEVIIRGRVTVYEPRGNYQLLVETMEPVGAGALQKAFEQLKAKLEKEGLFDQSRKRALPALPRHIGIVTSPTGAAIRDMLNVLARRFKGAHITLAPCKVQGDGAAAEIVKAIELINKLPDLDVLIVGRGGGSIEDLWCFNEEVVARAIAASRVPVISAVGHEIDFTIADFVADLRAPTPSAAAELVVKNAQDLLNRVIECQKTLRIAITRQLTLDRQRMLTLAKGLIDPQRRLQDASIRCDELMQRLENSIGRYFDSQRAGLELIEEKFSSRIQNYVSRIRHQLANVAGKLDSVSPLAVLQRGYSFVSKDGKILKDSKSVKAGESVKVQLAQGSFTAEIVKVDQVSTTGSVDKVNTKNKKADKSAGQE